MDAIKRFLDYNKGTRVKISVVGDMVIDEYHQVTADTISPEFPIPILLSSDGKPHITRPGGASNVCCQLRHFNADVQFFGFIDAYGEDVLGAAGINTQYSVQLPREHHIPLKKRYYDGQFPLVRLDVETPNYGIKDKKIHQQLQAMLLSKYDNESQADVTIFSNYNKGVFTDYEHNWADVGTVHQSSWVKGTTIVDPNSERPVECWAGCTILKPNDKEAKVITGTDNWKAQCDQLHKRTNCKTVVITQGGHGVVGSVEGKYFEYRPRHDTVPESVIGAGDCFIAFLTMAVAREMSIPDAAEVAFEAAAIYVNRKYNEPIAPWSLHRATDPIAAKIYDSADDLAEHLQFVPGSRVLSNGCFDILHNGHVDSLKFAKKTADILIVAVNSDDSIRRLKGKGRPLTELQDRINLLASLEMVDFVIAFDEDTPIEVIRKLRPKILVKGEEYRHKKVAGSDEVEKVFYAPMRKVREEIISTSKLLETLAHNE